MWYSHQRSFSAIRRLKLIQRKSLWARQHCSNFLWERSLNKTLYKGHILTIKESVLLNVFVHTLNLLFKLRDNLQELHVNLVEGYLSDREKKMRWNKRTNPKRKASKSFISWSGTKLTFSWNRRKIYFALQKMRRSSVTPGEPFQNSIALHKKCNTFLGENTSVNPE